MMMLPKSSSLVLSPGLERDQKVLQEDASCAISRILGFVIIMAQSNPLKNPVKSVAANILWRFAKERGPQPPKDPEPIAGQEMNQVKILKKLKKTNPGFPHSKRSL